MPRTHPNLPEHIHAFAPTAELIDESVASVMRPAMRVVPEAAISDLRDMFDAQRAAAGIVVDAWGMPVGLVSPCELASEAPRRAIVRDVMRPVTFCIPDDTPVLVAARIMVQDSLTLLPVVTRRRAIVGVVGADDLVRHVMTCVVPT